MSDDGNGGTDRLQGQIIGEVRAYRNRMGTAHTWTMRLTSEEVDALLAAADERDALKRELVGDPDLPAWLAPKIVAAPLPGVPFIRSDFGLADDTDDDTTA